MSDKSPVNKAPVRRYSLALLAALMYATIAPAHDGKLIIGATEVIEIEPSKLQFKARVDTGAQTSSIHAEDVEIDLNGGAKGKPISFTVVNREGQSQRIHSHVVRQIVVKTSEGSERRYAVPMIVTLKQHSKTVLVTLNDRAHMRYRLLLGRNWLRDDYIVDIELNDED
jgi:hypothetical protein